MDRVGGGDSFASGLIYGLMTTGDAQTAVDYGAAHGALAMTTPGDTTMADKSEVEAKRRKSTALKEYVAYSNRARREDFASEILLLIKC